MKSCIAIINYGMGNLRSVQKAFEKLGFYANITSDPKEVLNADAVVLPGVGAFRDAIKQIKALRLHEAIHETVSMKKPFLGICLGMQLLFTKSYEGGEFEGLGLIEGEVIRFSHNLRIPHIGWNTIKKTRPNPLLEEIKDGTYFYFVHSYYAKVKNEKDIMAISEYGEDFPALVGKPEVNLFGSQFHPEKSQRWGLKIIENFGKLVNGGHDDHPSN